MYKQQGLFYHHLAPLELAANVICKQSCASFQPTNNRVDFKGRFNVLNFTITWNHLNWLQIWSTEGATSNRCKLALITSLHHLHCLIALNCPIDIISQYRVGIFISQSHIS